MQRRDFLKTSLVAGAGAVVSGCTFDSIWPLGRGDCASDSARPLGRGDCASDSARPLKVCVFADLHFSVGTFANGTPAFLERILARAEAERCDMVIHLGDMVHNLSQKPVQDLVRRYHDFHLPAYHVIGNHDQDGTEHAVTLEAFRLERGYYSFDRGGFRFIVLDPNYFCNEPGKFIHHSKGNYFKRAKGSTINWIPPDQMEWLKATIDTSPVPCVVLSHQSFERGPRGGGVTNAREVREVFNAANAKHPGRVRLVMNGHHHVDHVRILDDLVYWDVNSANHYWWGGVQTKYPKDYVEKHRLTPRTLAWKDPLSAVLTLYPDGRISVKGASSDWLFGVTPRMAGFSEYDGSDRLIAPRIRSFDVTLNGRAG